MSSVFGITVLSLLGFFGLVSCNRVSWLFSLFGGRGHTEFSLGNAILNASSLLRVGNLAPVVLLGLGGFGMTRTMAFPLGR